MRKVVGVSLAVLLALPLAAGAAEITGKIQSVTPGDTAVVLEDGTTLTVHEFNLQDLRPGMTIGASYQEMDGKKVVTELEHRVPDGDSDITNFAPAAQDPELQFTVGGDR